MNDTRVKGTCMICGEDKSIRHIDLYVFGSEGLRACHDCEMKLVEFVKNLSVKTLHEKLDLLKTRLKKQLEDEDGKQ